MARKSAKQVGALWRHEKEGIGAFLTGSLDLGGLGEVPIAIFPNQRKKKGSKEPDYRIVLSERSGSGKSANAKAEVEAPAAGDGLPY